MGHIEKAEYLLSVVVLFSFLFSARSCFSLYLLCTAARLCSTGGTPFISTALQVYKARSSQPSYFWKSTTEYKGGFKAGFEELIYDHGELVQSILLS